MGVSRRRYASMRGVSDMAVRKAIASGRISVEADGTIDPEKADAEWARQTDPAKQRGVHAQALGTRTAASTARAAATKPVPKAAIDAVNATLGDSGDAASGSGGEVSFLRARMANEVLKAQTARVRLEKMKGELVDRARATNAVFDLARRERDAWLKAYASLNNEQKQTASEFIKRHWQKMHDRRGKHRSPGGPGEQGPGPR